MKKQNTKLTIKKWAVVVTQMAFWSLQTPEVRGWIPAFYVRRSILPPCSTFYEPIYHVKYL